jgi:hypothetical protein
MGSPNLLSVRPNPSRHLVDIFSVRMVEKKRRLVRNRRSQQFKIGKTEEAALTETSRFFNEKTRVGL